ncbi:hypothetical protein BS17DRAFT_793813 [Gyrodon lividus]|nr:hypothetical protein BS17DRAFT_793813 [Gyrodon lividus]
MSSPLATLPAELIPSIISFAAEHRSTLLALSLVSSWVHNHVGPALYHTIRLWSSRALASFISTSDHKTIETVLSRCTGVTSLACDFSVASYVHCSEQMVSHLRIQLTPSITPESVAQLSELPQLTHLTVAYKHALCGSLDTVNDMLRPVVQEGKLRVLILQIAGAGDVHSDENRKWNKSEEMRRAPRSILSQWEDSDAFWHSAEMIR